MYEQATKYGLNRSLALPYEEAVARVRDELAKEGFGILTEIDVKATFQKKLDVTFRPYIILGACNPPLAHRALSVERDAGLLLPCNVVVYAGDAPGTSVVGVMDPAAVMDVADNEDLRPVAMEARTRLTRMLEHLA